MPRAVLEGTAELAGSAVSATQSTRLDRRGSRLHRGTGAHIGASRQRRSAPERSGPGGADRGPDPSAGIAAGRALRAVRPGPDPRAATRDPGQPDPGTDRADQDTG